MNFARAPYSFEVTMKTFVPLALTALLLLVAAWLIESYSLWSRINNFTVPWFCSSLALALLIVLVVCGLRGQAPSELPWLVVVSTFLVTAVILVAGMEIDSDKYELSGVAGSRWELAGFLGMLLGLLLVCRSKQAK